jgi:hypothetical protein
MSTSPRKGTGISKKSYPALPAETAESCLIPSHWPELLKVLVLVAFLWATTLGLFFVTYVFGWMIGS